jgi:thiol-disulfide isomerase/thioredoxin
MVALAGSGWIYYTRVPDQQDTASQVAAHVNFRAPDFSSTTLEDGPIALRDLRGKVVLLNFWATWCPPCRAEMPAIQSVYQAHPGDMVVLAVNEAEAPGVVKDFVSPFHFGFPILLDRDAAIAQRFRVQGLPTSYFVDRDGIIRAASIGPMDRATIESRVAALTAR